MQLILSFSPSRPSINNASANRSYYILYTTSPTYCVPNSVTYSLVVDNINGLQTKSKRDIWFFPKLT